MEVMTDLFFWGCAGAIFVAALNKGTFGMGFPLIATPLIALLSEVPTAVVLTLIPNICMDLYQSFSRPWQREDIRRVVPLILPGVAGILVGTKLLATLPGSTLRLCLGLMILAFTASQLLPWNPTLPRSNQTLWSTAAGAVIGVMGGLTNVFSPVVILFYAMGLDKATFVQSLGAAFLAFKLAQVAATYHFELWTGTLAMLSLPLAVIALLGYWCGRRIQLRLPETTFRRAVLVVLSLAGASLVLRSLVE
ncbi:MAG: sulfite exporter TauE/SafE family protein [Candidatus Methylomirabilales bacterium]